MKKEDQVVSIELAKEMEKLGIEQDSVWYWTGAEWNDEVEWVLIHQDERDRIRKEIFSAFTVAELGEMLPQGYWESGKIAIDSIYFCSYVYDFEAPDGYVDELKYGNTEADARAKMWIYLKKEVRG